MIDKSDESGRTFEVFMTPEDFLRSFTPGVMQPRKYGLDSFKIYQPEKHKHKFSDTRSIFYKLGENGLISFSDYLFLMTLLSTSPNDFALAFKIFDINGDGELDKDEFLKVQHLIMSQTTVGQRHRDHITRTPLFEWSPIPPSSVTFSERTERKNSRHRSSLNSRRVYTPISCEWSLKEGMQWTVSMA